VQIDGSEHRCFEDRAEPCTLLVFVDDATSKLMQLRFVPARAQSHTSENAIEADHFSRPGNENLAEPRVESFWGCVESSRGSVIAFEQRATGHFA
jgi:hypothetical protein